MSAYFEQAFKQVVGIEGRFSDDPDDSGGATMFGITERLARAHGYTGATRNLPLSKAQSIYRAEFWDPLRLEDVAGEWPAVAAELFEQAVNQGTVPAARHFQRCLNVLNRRGQDYPDISVDGRIGPGTLRAFAGYMKCRDKARQGKVMVAALNAMQGAFYIELAERREKDERFVFGWFEQRVAA
jgi:lysozyme family protein